MTSCVHQSKIHKICSVCNVKFEAEDGNDTLSLTSRKTLYGHLPEFRLYLASKYEKELFQRRLQEAMGNDERFTALCIKCRKGQIPENFYTQAAVRLINEKQILDSSTPIAKQELLHICTRRPIICPVTNCGHYLCATGMLEHFMQDEYTSGNLIEILEKQETTAALNHNSLLHGNNICIGVLLYGGKNEKQRPAMMGLSLPNSSYSTVLSKYKNHLPILIMACKTHLSAMISPEMYKKQYTNENPERDILVFWLISMQTLKPMYAELTIENGCTSKGLTVQIRNMVHEQSVEEFLNCDVNYLYLSAAEIRNLTDSTGNIVLKIKIHESDNK